MLETTEGGMEKLGDVTTWRDSKLFSEAERLALEYAQGFFAAHLLRTA